MSINKFVNITIFFEIFIVSVRLWQVALFPSISLVEVLLWDFRQWSTLGSILFNIFTKNLFYGVKESKLHNFANDNTILSAEFSVEKLLKTLENESQIIADWFRENYMIVNEIKI